MKTPREAGIEAFHADEGNTLAGLKAAFDAYEAVLIAVIEDVSDDAPSAPFDNGGTRDGWQMACHAIAERIRKADDAMERDR